MVRYILVFGAVIIAIKCISQKIRIKWKTFIKKGFLIKNGPYGVYCYDGKQGNFKTYSIIEFLLQNKDKRIYSNLKSLMRYLPLLLNHRVLMQISK